MLSDPFAIIVTISVLVVLVILMAGIGTFGKGGDFALKHSNRLMRYRVGYAPGGTDGRFIKNLYENR